MRAVTFQAPGVVSVEERPEPELLDPEDAIVRIEATGVCGSDLHIYHGRVQIEPGFTIGHEYVGTVVAAGDAVTRVVDEDMTHRQRRGAQEMLPVIEAGDREQLEVGLVHQRRGLHRPAGTHAPALAPRQPPDVLIE